MKNTIKYFFLVLIISGCSKKDVNLEPNSQQSKQIASNEENNNSIDENKTSLDAKDEVHSNENVGDENSAHNDSLDDNGSEGITEQNIIADNTKYSVIFDSEIPDDKISNKFFKINNIDAKLNPYALKQLNNNSIIIAGSSSLVKQPIFIKTDLKGNIDSSFNDNTGFATVDIPGYNFRNLSGKLFVNPNTKDIYLFGLSNKKTGNTSANDYTIVSIKQDGKPNNAFNGLPYFVNDNLNFYDANILDIYFENENSFSTLFWNTNGTNLCYHNPPNVNCSILSDKLSTDMVNKVKVENFTAGKYVYVGQSSSFIPKLWSVTNKIFPSELKIIPNPGNQGKAYDVLIENDNSMYIVGCSTFTNHFATTIWKMKNYSHDYSFGMDGKKIYDIEQGGCWQNIFKIKNNYIAVGTGGESLSLPGSHALHLKISELDFTTNISKEIFTKFDNILIKDVAQIGNDIYVIATDGYSIKFVKTKLVEVEE